MEPHTTLGSDAAALFLTAEERRRHIAIFGATGAGKSTLLRRIAKQDMARGDGLMLIDPHGALAQEVLADVPAARLNHVAYLNPADLDFPIGLNVVDDVDADQRAAAADAVVGAMHMIWHDSWGPRLEIILRHAVSALIETPNASLLMLPRLLTDDAYRERVVSQLTSPLTRLFFENRFAAWRDTYRDEAIDPVLNKIEAFLAFPALRNILGQSRSTLDLRHALARSLIIIVNLNKGQLGAGAAHLMGALLLARVQSAGMARLAGDTQRDFHIMIDEAQNFSTMITTLLTEGRKFGLSVTAATQHLAGLDEVARAALLGNAGTLVVYRVASSDAEVLAPEFDRLHAAFNPRALTALDRGEAVARSPGGTSAHLSILPLPPAGSAERAKRQSRRHYGVPREHVESRIARALGLA